MSDFIKAAVIGHPIGHSKSPLIHNYWIEQYGLRGSYEAIDIAPVDFADGLRALIDKGYTGFNLTIPHKTLALELCDEVEENAKILGAVNTIKISDGKIIGCNTDGFGFWENIVANVSDFDVQSGPAVILGAGGAARAVLHSLLELGVPEIILTNRTREKAESIRNDMIDGANGCNVRVVDWEKRSSILRGFNFLVNTTSLGMNGQPSLDIDLALLPDSAVVNDIVYAPLYTPLLMDAKAKNCRIVTGIGMLIHQARPAFEGWFGVMPDVTDALIEKVLE